jgi:hypothetical protein
LKLVVAASVHADTFFSVTMLGEVAAHTIRDEMFEKLVPQRYENPLAQKVETNIYCRQFNSAFENLVSLTRSRATNNKSMLVKFPYIRLILKKS